MYASSRGREEKADIGKFKLRDKIAGEVCPIQSVTLNVPNSEKWPLSKTKMKCASSGPRHCRAWPCPFGKYQTSPGAKSADSASPLGEITVVRTFPRITNAHSAAIACQCSSRKPPGFKRIDTPAIVSEMGNSSTFASLAEPPEVTRASEASMSYLKFSSGACFLYSGGAALIPAGIARPAAAIAAVVEAAVNNSRRLTSVRILLDSSCFISIPPTLAQHWTGLLQYPHDS